MNDRPNGVFVAATAKEAFVRLVGRGTHRNSQALRQFAAETMQRGCDTVVVDLAECQGMDSTFLGVLAGLGLGLRQRGQSGHLHVLNVNERNAQSMRALGLDRLMRINAPDPGLAALPAEEFRRLPGSDASEAPAAVDHTAAAKLMLEAHENLCRTDPRNEATFKDVKHFLRDEIDRRDRKTPDTN